MAENNHGSATGAHTAADGHKGAFPPFEANTFASQLVSFAIFFVALYLIVSRIALPRVGGILADREKAIEGALAEAQKMRDQSDAELKAYESELAAARAKAQAIGSEAREKLAAQAETERKQLEDSLAAKLAEAEKSIAAMRTTAMGNVRGIATDTAGAIVQQLTGLTPDGRAIETAVDASLKG